MFAAQWSGILSTTMLPDWRIHPHELTKRHNRLQEPAPKRAAGSAMRGRLAELGAIPVAERCVRDGKYASAAGVSAGVDLALTLAIELAGREVAEAIQLSIEYDPAPPIHAGSPETAPAQVRDYVLARIRARLARCRYAGCNAARAHDALRAPEPAAAYPAATSKTKTYNPRPKLRSKTDDTKTYDRKPRSTIQQNLKP